MKEKIKFKMPESTAFFAALIFGVLTHVFGLVNVLHNCDDIAQQPGGYGTGISSGRWLLSILGDVAEVCGLNYNLPVVNGLLFIVLISISAAFVIRIFHVQNHIGAALIGMLFSSFPSVFSILTFRYTAVYYGISVLLAIVAVWVWPQKYGILLSAFCIACSLGIYQAFVPFSISLFVLLLMQQAIEGNTSFGTLVIRGVKACISLILGLLIYYVALKVFLKVYGTELSDYQGVNEMGQLSLREIPLLIKKAFYSFCMLPFKDYCGLSSMGLLKVTYLLLGVVAAGLFGFFFLKKAKNCLIACFVAVLCALFPVAVNFVVIMCPDGWFYTLMVYPFVMIGCVPVILYESLISQADQEQKLPYILNKVIAFLLSLLIGLYSYQSNVSYGTHYFSNKQVENYVSSLVVQVRMTEGFSTEYDWALLGKINDPLLYDYWQYETYIGGVEFTPVLLRRDTMADWVMHYYGYRIPVADDATVTQLCQNEVVKEMPCWPNDGSIKIVDDTIVIKFEEIEKLSR